MKKVFNILIWTVTLFSIAFSKSLPKYLKPCKKNDPNLNQCALENGKAAFDSMMKGDHKFNIPLLNPLTIPSFNISGGSSLKVYFTDIKVHGLQTGVLQYVHFDLEKQHFVFNVLMESVMLLGNYKIDGKIMILPIQGNGLTNLTGAGGDYTYSFDWDFINKRGKKYAVLKNMNFIMKNRRWYFHFDNLFNGDKTLGDHVNKFMNENWESVIKELGEGITGVIKSVAYLIFSNYLQTVPFDEIFTD